MVNVVQISPYLQVGPKEGDRRLDVRDVVNSLKPGEVKSYTDFQKLYGIEFVDALNLVDLMRYFAVIHSNNIGIKESEDPSKKGIVYLSSHLPNEMVEVKNPSGWGDGRENIILREQKEQSHPSNDGWVIVKEFVLVDDQAPLY